MIKYNIWAPWGAQGMGPPGGTKKAPSGSYIA